MIPKHIEEKIKADYTILAALEDIGCTPRKQGVNFTCRNPFREDKSIGSFIINVKGNYAKDFATDKVYSPIDILMEGHHVDYPDALRIAARNMCIYVDDEFVKAAPIVRREPKKLPVKLWSPSKTKANMGYYDINPLVKYLYSLPLIEEDRKRLDMMLNYYRVGTSIKDKTRGWTIWWQIDELGNVHTAKFMAYKDDGHRNKVANPYTNKYGEQCYYSFDFMHSMVSRSRNEPRGLSWDFDDTAESYETCLFGLHLIDLFPEAEICIVESEKSALICSIFTDPTKRIWMATTGKSNLTKEKLMPIISRKRKIVLYPDYDGYKEWEDERKKIGYDNIFISQKVRQNHIESDGPKADIADIMLRLLYDKKISFEQQAVNELVDRVKSVGELIMGIGLQIDSVKQATEEEINEYGNIRSNTRTAAEGTI